MIHVPNKVVGGRLKMVVETVSAIIITEFFVGATAQRFVATQALPADRLCVHFG